MLLTGLLSRNFNEVTTSQKPFNLVYTIHPYDGTLSFRWQQPGTVDQAAELSPFTGSAGACRWCRGTSGCRPGSLHVLQVRHTGACADEYQKKQKRHRKIERERERGRDRESFMNSCCVLGNTTPTRHASTEERYKRCEQSSACSEVQFGMLNTVLVKNILGFPRNPYQHGKECRQPQIGTEKA